MESAQRSRDADGAGPDGPEQLRRPDPGKAYDAIPTPAGEVWLHAYDLHSATKAAGLPFFHVGIEVHGWEYFFSDTGIYRAAPASHAIHVHREAIPLGKTHLSALEVQSLLQDDLAERWTGDSYSLIGRNCQTFAMDFCVRLGLGEDVIPLGYRRLSDIGAGWRNSTFAGLAATLLSPLLASAGGSVRSCGSQSLGSQRFGTSVET